MTVARCLTRAARHCCGRCNHGGPSGGNCRDGSTQAHDTRSVSVDYLVEHGTCIDHIRPGYSTLPNSEQSRRFRGAVSQDRNRHYGVAPSPSAIVYLHEHVPFQSNQTRRQLVSNGKWLTKWTIFDSFTPTATVHPTARSYCARMAVV